MVEMAAIPRHSAIVQDDEAVVGQPIQISRRPALPVCARTPCLHPRELGERCEQRQRDERRRDSAPLGRNPRRDQQVDDNRDDQCHADGERPLPANPFPVPRLAPLELALSGSTSG